MHTTFDRSHAAFLGQRASHGPWDFLRPLMLVETYFGYILGPRGLWNIKRVWLGSFRSSRVFLTSRALGVCLGLYDHDRTWQPRKERTLKKGTMHLELSNHSMHTSD